MSPVFSKAIRLSVIIALLVWIVSFAMMGGFMQSTSLEIAYHKSDNPIFGNSSIIRQALATSSLVLSLVAFIITFIISYLIIKRKKLIKYFPLLLLLLLTKLEVYSQRITNVKSNNRNTTVTKDRTSLNYIKKYKNKFPHEVSLFTKGHLKSRIINLIGQSKYDLFLDYFIVQTPIEIVNDDYVFLRAALPHNFGRAESVILIDFSKNEITIGILNDTKVHVFYENRIGTNNNKFSMWLFDANQQVKNNKKYD